MTRQELAEQIVDNISLTTQIPILDGDREQAATIVVAYLEKLEEPKDPGALVAGIMVCERCGKTCRCPHCNKF